MASLVSNLSNYWPSYFLSYPSVCVCCLPNTPPPSLNLVYVCVYTQPTWLIYKAELYRTDHNNIPRVLHEVLIKDTASSY